MRPMIIGLALGLTACSGDETPAGEAQPAPAAASDTLGNDGPALLRATDVEGAWSVICQVDAPAAEVEVSGGHHGVMVDPAFQVQVAGVAADPIVIDRFVASSSTGDHLALVIDGKLTVLDTRSNTPVELDGFVEEPRYGLPDVAGFDRSGTHLVYLRGEADQTRAISRDLATGAETELDHGEGQLWRASFASDDWIVAHVLTVDADENGVLEGPNPLTSMKADDCTGQWMMGTTAGMMGDKPETRLIGASGGAVRPTPNLASVAGSAAFEVDPSGGIHRIRPDGEEVVAAGCGLVGVSVDGSKVLGSCGGEQLTWFSGDDKVALDLKVTPSRETVKQVEDAVWVRTSDNKQAIVDFVTGKVHPVDNGYQPRVASGRKVLLHRGIEGTAAVIDLDSGEVNVLPEIANASLRHVRDSLVLMVPKESQGSDEPGQPIVPEGPTDHAWIVDLQKGAIVGHTSPDALALSKAGKVLVPTGDTEYVARVVDGPLKWMAPQPPAG